MAVSKILRNIAVLGLCATVALSAVACNGGRKNVIPNENPEDITSISILSSDWEAFNDARRGNTPVYQELKKAAGCDIIAESVGVDMLDRTIELRRSDGDLPEMFKIGGPEKTNQYRSLIEEEEIIAISDYVNESTKDKYPNLYEYLKKFEYMKHNVEFANGKLWFIPIEWGNEKSLVVRVDWIENLNNKLDDILVADGIVSSKSQITEQMREQYQFKIPETVTEFYRLARAFTIYDPDGNGKPDTRGYVTSEDRCWDSWLYVACDTGYKQWVDRGDGTFVHTNTTDGTKVATSILNKMMAEGYISPDSLTFDISAQYKYFHGGSAGMMYGHNWLNYFLRDIMNAQQVSKEQAEKMIKLVDPPKGVNGAFGGEGAANYYTGLAINANMSEARIEKCLQFEEFLHSEEGYRLMSWGGENIDWEIDEYDQMVSLHKPDRQGFIWSLRHYDSAEYISETFRVEFLPVDSQRLHTNGDILVERATASIASQHSSVYPEVYTESIMRYSDAAKDYFMTETLKMMNNSSLAASWEFDPKTWDSDGWTKLYTISQAFDAAWNSYVNTYNTTYHGSDMQREFNEFINSGKAMKLENE